MTGFPQYFAILSRIKEEVRAIGADGGKVTSSHEPHVQAYFPKGKEKNTFSVHQLISRTIICIEFLDYFPTYYMNLSNLFMNIESKALK